MFRNGPVENSKRQFCWSSGTAEHLKRFLFQLGAKSNDALHSSEG